MSTSHPKLTDELLKVLLDRRSAGPSTATGLVRDVLVAVGTMPQAHRWRMPDVVRQRLHPVVLVVLLPLALVGSVLLAGGRNPAPVPDADVIAFVQATYTCGDRPCFLAPDSESAVPGGLRAERPTIVTVAGDGGDPTPLLDVPGTDDRPRGWKVTDPRNSWLAGPAVRWSPDGTRLAFRLFNDAPGIYLVDRDGSGLVRLVALSLDAGSGMGFSPGFSWSPDGTRIAYTYPYGGVQSPLYVVDTSDGRVTALGVEGTRTLAWSPDGSRIAFARSGPPAERFITSLNVIGADGTGEIRLTAAEAQNHHVFAIAWSPDGSRIAFELAGDSRSGSPNREGLYTIDPEGTGLRMLTEPREPSRGGCCHHLSHDLPLAWSPDGLRIASLGSIGDDDTGIIVANADGSGARGFGPPAAYYLDWSPDGSQLVYAAGAPWTAGWSAPQKVSTDAWSSIYVVGVDGTGSRWLAAGEYPDWSSGQSR